MGKLVRGVRPGHGPLFADKKGTLADMLMRVIV